MYVLGGSRFQKGIAPWRVSVLSIGECWKFSIVSFVCCSSCLVALIGAPRVLSGQEGFPTQIYAKVSVSSPRTRSISNKQNFVIANLCRSVRILEKKY